jgi:hypothetical protein
MWQEQCGSTSEKTTFSGPAWFWVLIAASNIWNLQQ